MPKTPASAPSALTNPGMDELISTVAAKRAAVDQTQRAASEAIQKHAQAKAELEAANAELQAAVSGAITSRTT